MAWSLNFHPFGSHTDFFTDRLCRIYTVFFFIILAIFLAVEIDKPGAVECWSPSHFTNDHSSYAEKACARVGQFLTLHREEIPRRGDDVRIMDFSFQRIGYIPVVLAGQALLFFLPWLLWCSVSSGCCSLPALVEDAGKISTSPVPQYVGATIAGEVGKLKSTAYSIVFALSYLVTKFFYWVLCLIQMAILSHFLNINFFQFHKDEYTPYYLQELENKTQHFEPFPKMALCGFEIRRLGNLQRYTVQCLLPVNDTVERYLYMIYAWLVTLLIILSISGVFQLFKTIFWMIGVMSYKESFVKRKISNGSTLEAVPKSVLIKFVRENMSFGVFIVLEIIEWNGSLHAANMAVNHMWEEFLKTSKIHIDQGVLVENDPSVDGQGNVPLVTIGGAGCPTTDVPPYEYSQQQKA